MKNLAVIVLLSLASVSAFSGEYNNKQQNNSNNQRDNSYQGYSGQKYQYDLNNQADNLRYQLDPNAQIRDELNANPKADIDRSLGQRGGGARW